jgi:ABC-type sugar transport system ATPase subunit
VALGRAIVRQPQAFLMDEPLSNLDAILRLQMRKDLIELTRSLGSTVIYVTHDQVEAMTMGHRLGVMKDGKLLQTGTPTEVYTRPANRFVAGFIGTPPMNFLTCDVLSSPAGRELRAGEILLGPAPEWLGDVSKVDVGVRPADLTLSAQGTGFAAVLSVAENLGGEVLAYAEAGGQTVSFIVPVETSPRTGEQVWLQPRPDRLHFFDPESGERMR